MVLNDFTMGDVMRNMTKSVLAGIILSVSFLPAYAAEGVSQQVQKLNSQLQAQMKTMQETEQKQLQTLNETIQTQLKEMQHRYQVQMQELNQYMNKKMKSMQKELQAQIKQVHDEAQKNR